MWVLRDVQRPTRSLHPAVDCFRALGYRIDRARLEADRQARLWRCFVAVRDGQAIPNDEARRFGEKKNIATYCSRLGQRSLQEAAHGFVVLGQEDAFDRQARWFRGHGGVDGPKLR